MSGTKRVFTRAHAGDAVAYLLGLFEHYERGPYLDAVQRDGLESVARQEWADMLATGEWAFTPEAAEATSNAFGRRVIEVTPAHVLTALAEWLEIEG